MSKSKNALIVNLKNNGNELRNALDIEKYFCPSCLKYPEYTIEINNFGNISLSHLCSSNKKIKIDLSNIEHFKSNINNKLCVNCKRIASNICLKCDEFICDNCVLEHESTKGFLNIEYLQRSVIPIINSQYYCKEHLNKVTHFCRYCKINLCEKECLLEHCHCKSEPFDKELNINPSGYNGNNLILKNLANLSRAFYECYKERVEKSNLTLNIILNYYLIEPINRFIKENKNNKGPIKEIVINNTFKKAEKESFYMFNSFGDEDFNEFYFKLVLNAQQGNIRSFHKLIDIKQRYISLQKYKRKIFIIRQNYLMVLKLSLDRLLDELMLMSNLKEFRNFPLMLMDVEQKVYQLQNIQNQLEQDLKLIKRFIISMDYRIDYELRRKIGNIIGIEMLKLFGEKIGQIEKIQYLLVLSIEDIETKIAQTNYTITNKKDQITVVNQLKEKYKKALEMLNDITSNKLKTISKIKQIKMPKTKDYSYKFKSDTTSPQDTHEETILNLFFIIKKKLGETFINSIHKQTVKINYLLKEELEKYQNKKTVNDNKEESLKNEISIDKEDSENHNRIETENENFMKGKEGSNTDKKKENEKSELTHFCKNLKIITIKKNIKIADDTIEQSGNSIDNLLIGKNNLDIESFLSNFYQNLKEKETKIFNAGSDINFESAINLYFKGEKSQLIIPLNLKEETKLQEKEDMKRIKEILKSFTKSESVREIKKDLEGIKRLIGNNMKNIIIMQKRAFDYIEDYGEFFNINSIIKKLGLSLPLNFVEINDKIKEIEKYSVETELYEKSFYICNVYAFVYYEEFIGFYKEIKEKIQKLNLENIFLLNEAKNILLKEAKERVRLTSFDEKLIENIWEKLRTDKKIIEDPIINDNLNSYVTNHNFSAFKSDLIALCGEKIKDINLKVADPQNKYLQTFMKQNGLYYEM